MILTNPFGVYTGSLYGTVGYPSFVVCNKKLEQLGPITRCRESILNNIWNFSNGKADGVFAPTIYGVGPEAAQIRTELRENIKKSLLEDPSLFIEFQFPIGNLETIENSIKCLTNIEKKYNLPETSIEIKQDKELNYSGLVSFSDLRFWNLSPPLFSIFLHIIRSGGLDITRDPLDLANNIITKNLDPTIWGIKENNWKHLEVPPVNVDLLAPQRLDIQRLHYNYSYLGSDLLLDNRELVLVKLMESPYLPVFDSWKLNY